MPTPFEQVQIGIRACKTRAEMWTLIKRSKGVDKDKLVAYAKRWVKANGAA